MATTDHALTDEEWVAQRKYWDLDSVQAAADPRTPETYIMRNGFRDLAWYQACTARTPMSSKLGGWLLALAASWPGNKDDQAQAIEAVCSMAQCKHTHQLLRIVQGLAWAPGDWSPAIRALAAHPASTDEVLAWALVNTWGAHSDHSKSVAAAAGSFVPYAMRLAHRKDVDDAASGSLSSLTDHVDAIVSIAASVNALFPDPASRPVAAQIALTFEAGPAELARAVHAAAAA